MRGSWDATRREYAWSEWWYTLAALHVHDEAHRVEMSVAIAELVYDRLVEHRML